MSDLDFSFQDSPWELYLNTKRPGETVSAAHFLTLLEEETESAVEDAFAALEERGLSLDISGLPVREFSGQAALRLKQELEWSEKGLDLPMTHCGCTWRRLRPSVRRTRRHWRRWPPGGTRQRRRSG